MMHAAPIPAPPTAPSSQLQSQSLSARSVLASPRVRRAAIDSKNAEEDLFSPTSAAALALSTLHHFGASRRPSATALKATRLFNNISNTAGQPTEKTLASIRTNASASASTTTSASPPKKEASEFSQGTATRPPFLTAPGYSNYPAASPPTAPYTPQIHRHHHHHHGPPTSTYQGQGPGPGQGQGQGYLHHDPRYSVWSQQQQQQQSQVPLAPSETPQAPTVAHRTSSPWAPLVPYSYPTPTSHGPVTYSMDSHSQSRGSTPSSVGPSPPGSRSSSACGQEPVYYHPPRASPVGFVGPSPTLHRTNSYSHNPAATHLEHHQAIHAESHLARLASATTLISPTPKRAKLIHRTNSTSSTGSGNSSYSRKKKSLGVLAENFLKTYQDLSPGATIVVDEAAVKLGVERRRIYDVVNILESICLVVKKHKNTYTWMSMDVLDIVFGRLQAQAIEDYPLDAKTLLGVACKDSKNDADPVHVKPPRKHSTIKENKSLAKLSQEFLQVFLVGHQTLSLPEASDKIQGTASVEELIALGGQATGLSQSHVAQKAVVNSKEAKAAAARGLKTKIRRLYDIANVFLSVGLLKKVEGSDSSRRPNFSWSWRRSAKEIYEFHKENKKTTAESGTTVVAEKDESETATETVQVRSSQETPATTSAVTKPVFVSPADASAAAAALAAAEGAR